MSKINICNQALNLMGARSIQSFDENTENARRCHAVYDLTRKALLRMHPWSFAKKRIQLAPVGTHPTFGYQHAFALPSDFVRVLDVGLDVYEIEARHILANTNVINLIYVFDQQNENDWDALFSECMVLYLVNKLAKPITGSNAEADSAWQELQLMLQQARSINAQERPTQDFGKFQSSFIGVRY